MQLKQMITGLLLLCSSTVFAGGFDELESMTSLDQALPYISKKVNAFYIDKTNEGGELTKKLYQSAVIIATDGDTDKFLNMSPNEKKVLSEKILFLLKDWLRDIELFNAMAVIRQKEAEAIKLIILKKKNKS